MTRNDSSYQLVKRDWGRLNEQYVRRGEVIFDLSFVGSWNDELEEMNSGKRGRPYRYPRSLVRFIRFLRDVWHLPLRQAEGMLRSIGEAFDLEVPDHSTLWVRLVREDAEPTVPPRGEEHVLAIDSTGLKVSERGEWIRNKYHLRRGFVKAHIAVDVSTAMVVAVHITDDRKGDAGFLRPLVEEASSRLDGRITKVIADGAYDTRDNFDFLDERGIEAIIRMRKNANMKRRGGGAARPRAVKERNLLGEAYWRFVHGYGRRWAVEGAFSAVKRVMGESLRSRRSDQMLREAQHKFVQYGRLMMA